MPHGQRGDRAGSQRRSGAFPRRPRAGGRGRARAAVDDRHRRRRDPSPTRRPRHLERSTRDAGSQPRRRSDFHVVPRTRLVSCTMTTAANARLAALGAPGRGRGHDPTPTRGRPASAAPPTSRRPRRQRRAAVSLTVRLLGPADVVGIDPSRSSASTRARAAPTSNRTTSRDRVRSARFPVAVHPGRADARAACARGCAGGGAAAGRRDAAAATGPAKAAAPLPVLEIGAPARPRESCPTWRKLVLGARAGRSGRTRDVTESALRRRAGAVAVAAAVPAPARARHRLPGLRRSGVRHGPPRRARRNDHRGRGDRAGQPHTRWQRRRRRRRRRR